MPKVKKMRKETTNSTNKINNKKTKKPASKDNTMSGTNPSEGVKKIKNKKAEKILEKSAPKDNNKTSEEVGAKGRPYTVSIALPGSILDNAQSLHLRAYLAGTIGRAAAICNVDEIVIFDEDCSSNEMQIGGEFTGIGRSRSTNATTSQCNVHLGRLLKYIECPQYLRKSLYPKHNDLTYAGLMNPLNTPHHMGAEDKSKYREGVVLDRPTKPNKGSFVECGLNKPVQIDRKLETASLVTVEMLDNQQSSGGHFKYYKGRAVDPSRPRTHDGLYWGYSVRLAGSLSAALTECPYEEGKYDVIVGTSEHGDDVDDFRFPVGAPTPVSNFTHLLVVFGGVNGLELAIANDEEMSAVDDPRCWFDSYLNTFPNQGSRTIRTEEAIPITMAALRPKMKQVSSPPQ